MFHIESLNNLTRDIYILPKLSKDDINIPEFSDYEKLILFGFYEYYDELDKYDIITLNLLGICEYNINRNLLMSAIYYNKYNLIKYLLARGVNTNITNLSGYNSYLYACCRLRVKIKTLKLLEAYGANINKNNCYGENAFLLVICYCKKNTINVLEYLKSRGINIHKITEYGDNAYFNAENIKIFKYLESSGINIHFKCNKNANSNNVYTNIIHYGAMTLRLLKYLKSRGVRNHYSQNYDYCKRFNFYKPLKYLLISNCDNRFKNITCYI